MKILAITHIVTSGESLVQRHATAKGWQADAKIEKRLWTPLRSWQLRAKHLRPHEVKRYHRWAFFDL